ncbi:hypothetical protein SAMN05661044_00130 [Olivibacter domesticus]|uniref:Uncharacterized protein n=1 Tax=Olivibacter domesticus TaxID=407022 RepID=A0A1H7GM16_OLID1|nr:hypothetical protein SAMN05661044_00130 [Olivibacter domesticus]
MHYILFERSKLDKHTSIILIDVKELIKAAQKVIPKMRSTITSPVTTKSFCLLKNKQNL